jgi:hypothetical protein
VPVAGPYRTDLFWTEHLTSPAGRR